MPTFGARQLAAIRPADVPKLGTHATLADKPTMRSHAYSLLRTIFASAVTDELIDANPARIVGAGRAKRVHKIRLASVEELGHPYRGDAREAGADGHAGVLVCAAIRRVWLSCAAVTSIFVTK